MSSDTHTKKNLSINIVVWCCSQVKIAGRVPNCLAPSIATEPMSQGWHWPLGRRPDGKSTIKTHLRSDVMKTHVRAQNAPISRNIFGIHTVASTIVSPVHSSLVAIIAFETFISKFKFFDRFQSRYAQQDTDFSAQFSTRRMFDTSTSAMSGIGHTSSASTSSLTGPPLGNNRTNLIVNYLPQDMNDRELYSLFRPSGPIETCRIMRDYKVSQLD